MAEETGELLLIVSQRVGHDLRDLAHTHTHTHTHTHVLRYGHSLPEFYSGPAGLWPILFILSKLQG